MAQGDVRQVFIGGCDRSGTTMLGSMLGGHPAMLCLPEAQFIARTLTALPAEGPFDPSATLTSFEAHPRFQLWRLALTQADRAQLGRADDYEALAAGVAALYARDNALDPGKLWIDHAPKNVAQFARLAAAFPTAKFIHMRRDGRAVANSWLPMDWGPRHILTLADAWALAIAQGFAAEQVLGDRLLQVAYEDVVANPEAEMQRVAAFLGLPFDAGMVRATGFKLPGHSQGTHGLLTGDGAVSKQRAEAWKSGLSQRQIELFEYHVGDLLTVLGYPLTVMAPKKPNPKEMLQSHVAEVWGRAIRRTRRKKRHASTK